MMLDVFTLISFVLSLYANVVMAWLVTIAADIAINKWVLRISPRFPEFRRGMLHDWNPVGLVSVGLASVLSLLAFAGLLGPAVKPFSVLIAIGVAFVATPVMALATRGRYYLRRRSDGIDSPSWTTTATPRASGSAAMSPGTRSSGRICWPRPSEDRTARCSTSRRWRSRSTIPIATCSRRTGRGAARPHDGDRSGAAGKGR